MTTFVTSDGTQISWPGYLTMEAVGELMAWVLERDQAQALVQQFKDGLPT